MTRSQDLREAAVTSGDIAKSLRLSCCSRPNIYHTGISPGRRKKKKDIQSHSAGADLSDVQTTPKRRGASSCPRDVRAGGAHRPSLGGAGLKQRRVTWRIFEG